MFPDWIRFVQGYNMYQYEAQYRPFPQWSGTRYAEYVEEAEKWRAAYDRAREWEQIRRAAQLDELIRMLEEACFRGASPATSEELNYADQLKFEGKAPLDQAMYIVQLSEEPGEYLKARLYWKLWAEGLRAAHASAAQTRDMMTLKHLHACLSEATNVVLQGYPRCSESRLVPRDLGPTGPLVHMCTPLTQAYARNSLFRGSCRNLCPGLSYAVSVRFPRPLGIEEALHNEWELIRSALSGRTLLAIFEFANRHR